LWGFSRMAANYSPLLPGRAVDISPLLTEICQRSPASALPCLHFGKMDIGEPGATPASAVAMDSVVVGHSAKMRAVFEFLRVIGNSESTVLITGESGTGKEVTATLIHQSSRRRHRPFVAVSCALFSETLIESELFGHERGAFTGAIKDRPGRFELAENGTIFLDDIDDVPLSMQVKLLRVLQNRTIERLGGSRTVPVNVRIIAGTKRDLKQMVAEGRFREDLYYRLNVLPIALPPLRERREDIPLLMGHFLERYFRRCGEDVPAISEAVRDAFMRYNWPGNVRELENACERTAQTCTCGTLRAGCVSAGILFRAGAQPPAVAQQADVADRPGVAPRPEMAPWPGTPQQATSISLDDRIRELEATLIGWALKVSNGNKSRAAKLLQIKRSTLGDRINRCGLARAEPAGSQRVEPATVATR
jgi:two-component system, NtrC family, response regulator AtoC